VTGVQTCALPIFFGCFRAVDFWDSANLRSLDVPPLAGASPELMAALSPTVVAVRQGSLDPEHAAELIRRQAEDYRSKYLSNKKPASNAVSTSG
jgi:hypothetical protein